MVDLSKTIQAKSDQLNSDDLVGGGITVKITDITAGNSPEQPVSVHYEGDNGKPWKPCKTMRRVLVGAWGGDGKKYVGRHITLYRDASVKWAGAEVGGIRISHMSHIDKPVSMSLAQTRGKKTPYTVQPLTDAPQERAHMSNAEFSNLVADGNIAASEGIDSYRGWFKGVDQQNMSEKQKSDFREQHEKWKVEADNSTDDDLTPPV